ncbi:acetyltransferase (GNAT) family protein [Arcticibacter pallidicorallinus]|uniref:Acetyltransferase (GNAT) family protein n=1 Tax=Arcticibacter pallidicorallinus TaxID=1259464 RepID=A0A2T0U6Y0_9SPHI|nr:GNAT family N-acetyltransferase [Arcticibacter pallidicorallinus]PRY53671.1 acetyltransferase (GNAT) family protein [Arcticibacter pallidicorallinus]
MYKIVRYSAEFESEWNSFLAIAKNSVFLFNRSFLEYHSDRFVDHSVIVQKKNKIVALFPANESGREIVSHGGLTFGGLIMHSDLRALDTLEIFRELLRYYREKSFESIIYKVKPNIFNVLPSEEDLYALTINQAVLIRRDLSSVIDLNRRPRFSESKRQAVKKCEKENIEINESHDYTEYWNLLVDVLAKFSTRPTHTVSEIGMLVKLFPGNIRLFEARKQGTLLAGLVIFDYGDVVHTQYMANSESGRVIGALDYLNHFLITNVFNHKRYYSFGISTERMGSYLNAGLIQQKEMMGARGVVHDFYKIELKND